MPALEQSTTRHDPREFEERRRASIELRILESTEVNATQVSGRLAAFERGIIGGHLDLESHGVLVTSAQA
jgi:hypothetical protein